MDKTVNIFYAADDKFIKYTVVSIHSLIKNSSASRNYKIYVLHTELSDEIKPMKVTYKL